MQNVLTVDSAGLEQKNKHLYYP